MKWLGVADMPADGVYTFSGAPTLNEATTFFFKGGLPTDQFVLGFVDEDSTFIPFDEFVTNESTKFCHGVGVILAVKVTGPLGTVEIGCKP